MTVTVTVTLRLRCTEEYFAVDAVNEALDSGILQEAVTAYEPIDSSQVTVASVVVTVASVVMS